MKVVPFGKYKGQPVEVLASDKAYLDWAKAQPDLVRRYGALFELVGALTADEADCTPEHNQMQARFLRDKELARGVVQACEKEPFSVVGVGLEQHLVFGKQRQSCHVDVMIEYVVADKEAVRYSGEGESCGPRKETRYLLVELKPTIGDDYPKVLRAMTQLHMHLRSEHPFNYREMHGVVLCDSYTGSVPLEDVQAIFRGQGIHFLLT